MLELLFNLHYCGLTLARSSSTCLGAAMDLIARIMVSLHMTTEA